MTDRNETVVEEYDHSCRIIQEAHKDSEDTYWYEGPLGRVKSFHSLERARLYADVQTLAGGFREEKTGERGVPPAVARARQDLLISYLVSNPTMGVEWVARFYDLEPDVVRDYTRMVRKRAAEKREGADDE